MGEFILGKSCIFLAMYLDGNDAQGESYFERYVKFLKFYRDPEVKEAIGYSDFVLVDNASDLNKVDALKGQIYPEWEDPVWIESDTDLHILRYKEHLPKGPFGFDYPYGWRMVFAARRILHFYDKIIFIDSDGFVLSHRLAHWIRDLKTGWRALWCELHKFPEANLHVLTKESYPLFLEFTEGDFMRYNKKKCMELTLPFTHIEKGFVADRFGEQGKLQTGEMDFYAQCRVKTKMQFMDFEEIEI